MAKFGVNMFHTHIYIHSPGTTTWATYEEIVSTALRGSLGWKVNRVLVATYVDMYCTYV